MDFNPRSAKDKQNILSSINMLISAPRFPSSLQPGPAVCPVSPPSLSALQLHTGTFHQPEDQTPTRSQLRWRVLTRAPFIRALAQAQTKQDVSSEAAGRMGPVWAEAAGTKSIFSSLTAQLVHAGRVPT